MTIVSTRVMKTTFKPKLLLKRSGEVYADGEYIGSIEEKRTLFGLYKASIFVKGVLRTFKADTKGGLRRIIEQHLNAKFLI